MNAEDVVGFELTNFARFGFNEFAEKIAHVCFADEANAHRLALVCDSETELFGEGFYVGFEHFADREDGLCDCIFANAVEKISLILVFVACLEEVLAVRAGVMAGRNHVGTLLKGGLGEELEFDFLIAHDVRIWRVTFFVLGKHVVDDFLLVFFFEIEDTKINAELDGDALGVSKVFRPRALHAREILGPVLHVDADDFVALLLQKIGRHGRIDATRHSKEDFHMNILYNNL